MLGKMPKMCSKSKMKMVNESEFDEFLSRISKTLYYGDEIMVEDHLSYPVIELAAEIYSDLKTGKSIDRLYLDEATEMTQKVKVNPCYMVLALLYIERLKDCNTEYLDNIAPSQLFLISLVLASKFHDDSEYELSLSMFDKFSDFSRSDIFQLELAFLSALQWKVSVSEEEFCGKLLQMEKLLAMKSANKRNWFTYTEMSTLLLDEAWTSQLTSLLVTVSAVCLTTYTAGVLTLLASSVLASHISSSAALVILSTTAQLSLLVPSCGTPPCTTNGTNSITSLPTDSIEETLEREILGESTTLEDLMSRMNFGNNCDSIRNAGSDSGGWNLKTKNCIRNTAGDFCDGQYGGSNPNIFSTFGNWNVRSMVETMRSSLGLLSVNDENMPATGCIRNTAWKNKNKDIRSSNDGGKTTENCVENDLRQYAASNADHTSIRMNLNSKRRIMPSEQPLDNYDSKLHDIPKAELTLHSRIDCGRMHSSSQEDYQVPSTVHGFIGIDSKTDSQATCTGHNSRVDANKFSHCLDNSVPAVSHSKDCRYNQNGSSVYGAFCLDHFQPDHNNVYESCEGNTMKNLPCKRILGGDGSEKYADSIQFGVLKRGYDESMLGYAESIEYDAELVHGYADSTKYYAESGHGYIESTLNTPELGYSYADSTQSHAESTLSSFIPLSFSHSISLLTSLTQVSLSDYLPPLKNISSLLLDQINDDLFSADFKFDLTTSQSTDVVEDRYRFVGIDSFYRTGVYRRENQVEILSC
uniref:Protein CNPPD1 n=1 Tax=Cacopsylla melanoneura TaxID=428564 RepID=A0A8D8V5W1_9HEMI